jgi:site-specific DNA-cytosine methylase
MNMTKNITAVDLFCGAGGTSTGLIQAAASIGKKVDVVKQIENAVPGRIARALCRGLIA